MSVTQDRSFGFPPVSRADARVLILGSLPGQASLAARQYYAQPRNAFWPLMGRLFGAGVELAYEDRLRRLTESGVALWDVCASARRPGSLDAKIEALTVAPNDFAGFFQAHRGIGLICFNGAAAERLFERHVSPTLQAPPPTLAASLHEPGACEPRLRAKVRSLDGSRTGGANWTASLQARFLSASLKARGPVSNSAFPRRETTVNPAHVAAPHIHDHHGHSLCEWRAPHRPRL